MANNETDSYFSPTAYNSNNIPTQPHQTEPNFGPLSLPLPWGEPQEILPIGFVGQVCPTSLQADEDKERVDPGYRNRINETLNAVFNHQRFRFTPLQGWTQLLIYMHTLGKWFFIIVTSMLFITFG